MVAVAALGYSARKQSSDDISFSCNACGKCCNSPPLMSIGELLHHETLFIGGLALRRVERAKPGDAFATGGIARALSVEDAELLEKQADDQLFRLDNSADYRLSLMAQAIDYETLRRCPALNADNTCSLQLDRKPAVCAMVPFDALYPDTMQHLVLLSRRYDAQCIVSGRAEGYEAVVLDRRVTHPAYRNALDNRRRDLAWEKQLWGNSVFASLKPELTDNPAILSTIPTGESVLLLPIIPALAAIANISEPSRLRCLRYAERQMTLLDDKIAQAISRKSAADKATTALFRQFRQHYSVFHRQFIADQARTPTGGDSHWTRQVHAYLGIRASR